MDWVPEACVFRPFRDCGGVQCSVLFRQHGGWHAAPFGQGLVDVAQEHFAFFSADGALPLADEVEEPDIDGEPLEPGDAGYLDLTPGEFIGEWIAWSKP